MAKLAQIDTDTGLVYNVILADPADFPDAVDVTGSQVGPGWAYNGDGTFAPPAPAAATFSTLEFLRLFTRAERIGIRQAAATDDVVADFLYMLERAQDIRADHPETVEGLDYLVSAGLLTAARRAEIV